MIAAAPPRDPSLGLVQLIFSLEADQKQPIPDELKTHLITVITEAKALSHPNFVPKHANPEAIALAVWMKSNKELTAAVEKITTFENIDPDLASKILEQMRVRPGY